MLSLKFLSATVLLAVTLPQAIFAFPEHHYINMFHSCEGATPVLVNKSNGALVPPISDDLPYTYLTIYENLNNPGPFIDLVAYLKTDNCTGEQCIIDYPQVQISLQNGNTSWAEIPLSGARRRSSSNPRPSVKIEFDMTEGIDAPPKECNVTACVTDENSDCNSNIITCENGQNLGLDIEYCY